MNAKFEAMLQIQPLQIVNLSFSRSIFEYRLDKMAKYTSTQIPVQDIYPPSFMFNSDIRFYEENNEQFIEVFTQVKALEESYICGFQVDCLGKYAWNGEVLVLTEEIKKSAFAWAVSAQFSAMREHIARETANGPFKISYYLPVAIINVIDKHDRITAI